MLPGTAIPASSRGVSKVRNPHEFYGGEPTAGIVASGNVYRSVTGAMDRGQAGAFTPPYPSTLEPAASVEATVRAEAGPR